MLQQVPNYSPDQAHIDKMWSKMSGPHLENQLRREFLGVCGLNPFPGNDSSSRIQMFSSHIGQTLVVKGATERYLQTGMEREYAKYTFNVKMPVNANIIKVIDRYRQTLSKDSIAENPQTVVLYEDDRTKEIGMVTLSRYCSHHQYFGFPYVNKPGRSALVAGASIPAGTILQDSPAVTDDGGYKYGVECNIALMSMPGVSEDGIIISRDVLDRFTFRTYETRVVEWGNKRFPLNLYGDPNDPTSYKPFPDIGDRIREDGLLMCLRSYDPDLAVVEQSIHDLREPNFTFDKPVYAGGAGGKIIDIRVHHDINNTQAGTPAGMEVQAQKYDDARRQFYSEILNEYKRLARRPQGVQLTPELHRMVVEAISVVGDTKGKRIQKLYRQAPLDDYRVEFVIEYEITPTIGFKLTDCHGGKGVICHIAEPHEMPVDEDGNRADMIMASDARVSRMNLGGNYEIYINSSARDTAKRIRAMLGIEQTESQHQIFQKLTQMEQANDERFLRTWDYLMGFYRIVSPVEYMWFTNGEYDSSRAQHLSCICKCTNGIHLFLPPENSPEMVEMVLELQKHYRPTYGPVTYIGNSGRRVTTKNPVRIGSMYIILLEKIGDDWTAVSSGKLQHFGVLSQVTNTDKFSSPTRNQAIRALGESEVRIYVSYAGPYITADILDRNNNPVTHREILHTLLEADKPTNITSAVDRNKVPLGGAKPLQLVKHIAECGGWQFHYQQWQDTAPYVRQ